MKGMRAVGVGASKNEGSFFGHPRDKDHNVSGPILGCPSHRNPG